MGDESIEQGVQGAEGEAQCPGQTEPSQVCSRTVTKPRGQTACGPRTSLRRGHLLFHSPNQICPHPWQGPIPNCGQCSPAHKYAGQNHLRGSPSFHSQVCGRVDRAQPCTTHRSYPQVCAQGRAGLFTDLRDGKRVTLGEQARKGLAWRPRRLAHETQQRWTSTGEELTTALLLNQSNHQVSAASVRSL